MKDEFYVHRLFTATTKCVGTKQKLYYYRRGTIASSEKTTGRTYAIWIFWMHSLNGSCTAGDRKTKRYIERWSQDIEII